MIKRTKHLQSGNSPKGISNLSWDSVWLYGFILACGFTSFYVYFCQIILPGRIAAFEIYGKILSRSAESPYAYRILAPFLIKALSAPLALTGLLKPKTAFLAGYSVFVLTSVELSVVLLFRLLRFWFDARFSLIGILLFCLMFAVAARDHFFQPWTLIEVAIYAAALILSFRQRGGWALVLTVIATLNRETGLFVPLLVSCGLPGRLLERKRIGWLAVLGATWFVVFIGVRLMVGERPHPVDMANALQINFQRASLAHSVLALAAFFSISFPIVLGWGRSPEEIRRCTGVLLLYSIAIVLYSLWWEVRLWLPMACVLLPLAVRGVQALIPGSFLPLKKDR